MRGILACGLFMFASSPCENIPVTQDDYPPPQEVTFSSNRAIRKGLHWLYHHQNQSGSWGNGHYTVATTSLAGLAFLAGGHVPGRSLYSEATIKAALFLMRMADKIGYMSEGLTRASGDSGMHGHGYATVFLSQMYGMCISVGIFIEHDLEMELKEALRKAVRVIEGAQGKAGGWWYDPKPGGDEGSVTVTMVQALRAARNAGFKVNKKVVLKAIKYINLSTDSKGRTHYSLELMGHPRFNTFTFALTAAGMSCLSLLGDYHNKKISKGMKYLMKYRPGSSSNNSKNGAWGGWYFYGNYYATMAAYQALDSFYWKIWFPLIRNDLVKIQGVDGNWYQAESEAYGDAFGTSIALQILQMPYRYLPIFQNVRD